MSGMSTVTSQDGTTIAYQRTGDGPPLVLVGGALNNMKFGVNTPLVKALAGAFTVYNYDRRGKGDSGDAAVPSVQREIEDLAALIDATGGPVNLYGISSGAVLALEAATALPGKITKLALYEPPAIVDDGRPPVPADAVERVTKLVDTVSPGAAVSVFLKDYSHVPGWTVAMIRLSPAWRSLKSMAPSLRHDFTVMAGLQQGNPLPEDRWAELTAPVLVMAGGKSPEWQQKAARAFSSVLPGAEFRTLPGQTHVVRANAIAPVLTEYFKD
jgi:pimeloyl-ACP methyl ester carboxylesterase